MFDHARLRFGINVCYDTRFPHAAAAVAVDGPQVLLVPAQNMMRRRKALWWQDRHRIRTERVSETGMWLVSADVTGQRDATRIGLGRACVINPAGQVIAHVPAGTTGIAVADINHPWDRPLRGYVRAAPVPATVHHGRWFGRGHVAGHELGSLLG